MELAPDGDLADYLSKAQGHKLSETQARPLLRQLVDGLDDIHKAGIGHRDIKPENIMFRPKTQQVLYADFGLAGPLTDRVGYRVGTPGYKSPELDSTYGRHSITSDTEIMVLAQKADIYALGATFRVVLTGQHPTNFFGNSVWKALSQDVRTLIEGMMRKEVKQRYTMADVLASPWWRP
jgi:calcium/calmodulin-dependent protein kinase I